MLPIKSSVLIGCMSGFISSTIGGFDQAELSLKTRFEGSIAIRMAAAAVRNADVISKEIFNQSVFRKIMKQLLAHVKEYTQKASVSIYEGSSVLSALDRSLANSKCIRYIIGDRNI